MIFSFQVLNNTLLHFFSFFLNRFTEEMIFKIYYNLKCHKIILNNNNNKLLDELLKPIFKNS